MEEIIRQLSSLNENVTSIGENVANISRRVDDIDGRVAAIESHIDEDMENEWSRINRGFVSVERGMDENGRPLRSVNQTVVFTQRPGQISSANVGDIYGLREVGGQGVQEGTGLSMSYFQRLNLNF